MFNFNFQMFNDDIPGIDADVLEQFKDELPQEEPAEQPEQQEEAHADHHSDNKDVEPTEQQTEEEEKVPEGSNVPYNRFKGVNERMKAAEARQRELEAELAKYKNATAPQDEQQQESPAPAEPPQAVGDFTAEQIKLMTAEARRRAAKQLNLSEEDVENIEYSDDPSIKDSYDALTTQYMGEVRKEVTGYVQKQRAYIADVQSTTAEYKSRCEKFLADPDYEAKWDKVCKAAQSRGQRFLMAAQGAIDRLDQGKGTSQDYFFVKDFMDTVLGDGWGIDSTPAKPKTNKKIQEAAKLPTAPEVGGSTKGDIVWDTPTITDYINSGRMDEIPPNVLKRIMGQQIAPGDYEE